MIMYAPQRQRARSLDGYGPYPPHLARPAGFDYPDIPYQNARRNSVSYATARPPPQHGFAPMTYGGTRHLFGAAHGPAVVTRHPISRGGMRISPRTRLEVEQAKQALQQGGAHGTKKKHVHFKDNLLGPLADLFRGRDRQQRKDSADAIPVKGYSFVKKLNTGGMSEAVNLVKKSGKLYIEKRVKIDGASGRTREKRARAELSALRRIAWQRPKHLNVMVEYLWEERLGFVSFILEYCDQGNLESVLKAHRRKGQHLKEDFVWHILISVSKGLAFLHHGVQDVAKNKKIEDWNSICHLDLKPCNVFLSSGHRKSKHPVITIGDFGCAITRSDIILGMEHPRLQECGTPDWYPPEGIPQMAGRNNTRYGPETDIWQMGATIHAVCRLLLQPDRSIYEYRNEFVACGSRYGTRLTAAVMWAIYPNWWKRPSAMNMAKEAMKAHEA